MKRVSNRKLRRARAAKPQIRRSKPCPLGVSLARFSSAIAICGALFASIGTAKATTVLWDIVPGTVGAGDSVITDGSGTWNTTNGNWTADVGVNNIAFTNGDDAIFGGGSSGTAGPVTLGTPITVGSLTFNAPFSGSYTLAGGTGPFRLTVNTGGITANAAATISADVTLSGAQLWSNTSSGLLTVSGSINNGATSDALTKGGTGTLRLANTATNTFTGGFILNAGTVLVGSDTAFGTGTLTINGGNIASDGTTPRVIQNGVTVNSDLSLGQAATNTGALTVAGTVALGTASGRIITVDNPSSSVTISGTLSGTGATAFTKSGAGTLILTGSNTFTGNIIIDGGFLAAGSDGGTTDPLSLGSAASRSITVTNGGGFRAISSINFNNTTVKAFTVGTGGGVLDIFAGATVNMDDAGQFLGTGNLSKTGLGTWNLASQSFAYSGEITISAGILNYSGTGGGSLGSSGAGQGTTVASGAEMTLSGALTTPEPLTLGGTGNMAFGTNGTLGGVLVGSAAAIATGPITLSSDVGIAATGTNVLTLSGIIGDGGSGYSLTKLGTGTVDLQGANTYSGATNIRFGTLRLSGATGSILNTASLTLNGGTLEIQNTAAANNANRVANGLGITSALGGGISFNNTAGAANFAETLGTVTLAGGHTVFTGIQNNVGQTSILTLSGLTRSVPGATANFIGTGLGLNTRNAIAITGQPAGFIGGWATADNEFAEYDTTVGSVTPMVLADYTTTTDPSAWTAAQHIKLSSGGTVVTAGTADINSLNLQGANASTADPQQIIGAGSTLRVSSGGILASGASAVSVSSIFGGTLTAGAGANTPGELIVTSNLPATSSLLISSVIADNGTGVVAMTKAGTGNLALAGSNTFTGELTVNQGTLAILGSVSTATDVTVNPGGNLTVATENGSNPFGTASITLNGGTLQNGDLQGRTVSNAVTINGDVALGSANGGSAGGLTLSGGINLGGTQRILTINNPAASTTNNSGLVTFSGPLTGTAGFAKAGAGTLSLAADNSTTLTGTIVATAGILRITADNNLGDPSNGLVLNGATLGAFSDLTLASTRVLTMGTSGGTISTATLKTSPTTVIFNGVIDGAGLTKTGAGTLILGGNNTYQGLTTISAGALRITHANALGATGLGRSVGNAWLIGGPITTVTSGAALELSGGLTVGDESLVLNGTGLANGGALRSVSGNNTWGGQIFLNTAGGNRINADAGSTLTLPQQITAGAANPALTLGGAGNIIVRAPITTGATATLTKEDTGTVTLEGANTAGGALTISAGSVILAGPNASLANSGITIGNGAVLTVSNSTGANNTNRFTAATDPSLTFSKGGTFNFFNDSSLGNDQAANFSDALGSLIPTSGAGFVNATQASVGQTSTLNFTTLGARGPGATVNFGGAGLGDNDRNRIVFATTAPTVNNGIIGAYATTSGTLSEWATYDTGATAGSIRALQTYQTGPDTTPWATTDNVKITAAGTTTLTANRTINTLNLQPGAVGSTLDIVTGQTLTLSTNASNLGGLLMSGADAGVIRNGTLTAGTTTGAELIVHQFGSNSLDIQSVIANNAGGAVTLVKAGTGELILSGNNTFVGGVTLNSGRLTLNNAGALNSTTAQLVTINGGTLRLNGFNAGINSAGISNVAAVIENGHASTASTAIFTVPVGSTPTYAALLQDGGIGKLNVTKTVSGTIAVASVLDSTMSNPASTYTGMTTITGGGLNDGTSFSQSRLIVPVLANVGSASSIGAGDGTSDATNAASLVLNGGILQYTGAAVSTDRLFTLGTVAVPFRNNAVFLPASGVTAGTGTGGIDSSGTGPINFTNAASIGYSGTAVRQLILSGSNTGDNTLAALIGDNGGFATSVYKTGAGRWLLTNNSNSFTGGAFVNQGTLAMTSASTGALGSGPISILNGATLELNGGTISNQIQTMTVSTGTVGNGSIMLALANTTLSGPFRGDGGGTLVASDPTFNVAPNVTLSLTGTVTYAGKQLIKQGDGTLLIQPSAAISTVPYGMQINAGTVRLVGTGSFSNVNLLNIPAGVLDISQANIGGTPATITFMTDTSNTTTNTTFGGGAAGASSIVLLGGNTLAIANGSSRTINFSATNNNSGAIIGDVGALASGSLSLAGGTRTFQISDSSGAAVDFTVNAAIVNGSGTNVGLTKTELGTMLLAGANTYDGATTLNLGTLIADYGLSTASKFSDTGSLTLSTQGINNNNFTTQLGTGTLILQGRNTPATVTEHVGTLTLGAGYVTTQIFGTGTVLRAGSYTRTAVGGLLTHDTLNGTGTVRVANTSNVPTLATGTVLPGFVMSPTAGVVRFGATDASGNVTALTGTNNTMANTWADGDHIDVTAAITGTVTSPTAAPLVIGSLRYDANAPSTIGVASGTKLGLLTGNILVTSTAAANAVTIGSLGSFIESNNDARDLILISNNTGITTINGNLRSDQGVTKAGTGTFNLAGNNTFTGNTIINEGTLTATGGKAIGDTSTVVLAGRTTALFNVQGNETVGAITSGGNIATTGTGINIGSGATLNVFQTTAVSYNGGLYGAGNFIKDGAFDLTFNSNPVMPTKLTGTLTINRNQLFVAGTGNVTFGSASAVTLNGGSLIIDNNGASASTNRILDTAPLALYNTGGINGLFNRTDQAATRAEAFGATTLGAGANYITSSPSATTAIPRITLASLARTNNSTLLVRGNALGDVTQATVNRGEVTITGAAPALVGGAGAAGTKVISIVPWALGDSASGGVGDNFVTYSVVASVTNGFRPLKSTEYETTYANLAGTPLSNYSTATTQTGLVTATANSLRIDAGAGVVNLTGAGGGTNNLTITSGAILLSAVGTTNGSTISGFDNILTGGSNEYVVFTTGSNAAPASSILTINSPLTTAGAALTKAGAGTLILGSTASTFTGRVTINQGVLQVNALNQLGAGTQISLNGMVSGVGAVQVNTSATLKFGGAFDPSARTVQFGVTGASTFKTGGGVFDTNGFDIAIASAMGNAGNGGFVKTGLGNLTLNAGMTNTGDTFVTGGTLTYGVANALATGNLTVNAANVNTAGFSDSVGRIVMLGASNLSATGGTVGTLTTTDDLLDLQQGYINVNLASTSTTPTRLVKSSTNTISLRSTNNSFTGAVEVQTGTLQFYSVADSGTNSGLGTGAADPNIRLGFTSTTGTLQYLGNADSASNRVIDLQGTTGGATLAADSFTNNKLVFTNSVIANSNGDALGNETNLKTLTLQGGSVGENELSGVISETNGSLRVTKTGTGLWNLTGANTYSGVTAVVQGTLDFGSIGDVGGGASALGAPTTAASGTIALGSTTNLATLKYTGATASTDRVLAFAGTSGTITLDASGSGPITYTSAFTATGAGVKTLILDGTNTDANTIAAAFANLSTTGTNATPVTKNGVGTWALTAANTFTGATTVNRGKLTLSGAGKIATTSSATVNESGTLELDNTATPTNDRLGNKAVTLQGGTLTLSGTTVAATNVSETVVTLTVTSAGGKISLTGASGGTTTLTATTLASAAGGGSAVFSGLSNTALAGNANMTATTFNVLPSQGTGANDTFTRPIRADILGDATPGGPGTGFLVKDSTSSFLRPLNPATEISPTLTNSATTNFGNFAATQNYSANSSANSLSLLTTNGVTSTGGGQAVQAGVAQRYTALGALNQLTLTTGGVLATANTTLEVGSLALTNSQFNIHTVGSGTTLDFKGYLVGANTLLKADAGTLRLNQPQYFTGTGGVFVNDGTLSLNSGVANTLIVTPTATIPTLLPVISNAGTLNLGGQNQAVGAISSTNTIPGGGGSITSSGGTLVSSSTTATTFAGNLDGALNLAKYGSGALTLSNASTYTGTTTVGGSLILKDSGSIASSTGGIALNYGTLTWDDSGLTPVNNRLGTSTLTSRGGIFLITSRAGSNEFHNLGTLALEQGNTNLSVGSTASSVQAAALTRNAANAATMIVFPLGGTSLGAFGPANGALLFTTAPTLNNNIIGPWAVTVGASIDWLTYAATPTVQGGLGAAALGTTAAGFADYTFTGANFTGFTPSATANVKINLGAASQAIPDAGGGGTAGTVAMSTLVVTNTANAANLTFTDDLDTLNLSAGGFIHSGNFTTLLGSTTTNGIITAGGLTPGANTDLFLNNNQGALTINSRIADNPNGGTSKVRPVLWNYNSNTASFVLANGTNTFSGGMVVNGNNTLTVQLGAASGTVIPLSTVVGQPGLTINNAIVTMTTATTGQIASGNDVVINGGGKLNFFAYTGATSQTLKKITFNNLGGTDTPTLNLGSATNSTLILSDAAPITAVNENFATTPTISTGFLQLSNATPAIDVTGNSPDGLIISAVINSAGGPISKTGGGSLILSGTNTFTTGFNLDGGSLIIENNAAVGTGGMFAIADATTIMAGTATRTVSNPTNVAGNFTFGGTVAANGLLILSGQMNLAAGAHTITVTSPLVSDTISGKVTGAGVTNLTKAGAGTLTLSATTNDYAGTTTVSGGVLKLGAAGVIPNGSALAVNSGALFDLNNFDETTGILSGDVSNTTGGMVTNSGTASHTLTVGADNGSATFAGLITNATGALKLVKTGSGTQTLSGANSYTGPTDVTAGTLLINGLQGSATGAVTVSAGATLGGNGTIGGATTILDGGNLKPGASAGLLTFTNDLTLTGSTTNSTFEIQGTARGVAGGYDAVNLGASSTLTYAGILTLDISSTLPDGTYDLFSFTNAPTGNFFNVTLTGSGGYTGNLTNSSGVWTGDSQGQTFTFTQASGDLLVATVPEPSALVSLLGGLGVLLGFRRSRRTG